MFFSPPLRDFREGKYLAVAFLTNIRTKFSPTGSVERILRNAEKPKAYQILVNLCIYFVFSNFIEEVLKSRQQITCRLL